MQKVLAQNTQRVPKDKIFLYCSMKNQYMKGVQNSKKASLSLWVITLWDLFSPTR